MPKKTLKDKIAPMPPLLVTGNREMLGVLQNLYLIELHL